VGSYEDNVGRELFNTSLHRSQELWLFAFLGVIRSNWGLGRLSKVEKQRSRL
jgi:hypothetical protein